MIKAIALDDEPLPLRLLKTFAAQTDFVDMLATFTSPIEAKHFIEQNQVDLIFLDIQMPAISGINFFKTLPQGIQVIFTTAYSEYAVEGFNLKAVDYLLKPFEFDRFLQGVERAKEFVGGNNVAMQKDDSFFLKVEYGVVKITYKDILYVEGLNNYLKVYLPNNKSQLVRMSMKEMADKLESKGFMRVHRSYIVPLAKVTGVRNRMVYLEYAEIPIGVNYFKEVQSVFEGK